MSVGGRNRWLRGVCAVSTLFGLGASVVAGCGGRTSALDPDIYTDNPAGGSSSFLPGAGRGGGGQSTTGGVAPSGGKGGSSSKPKPGAVDPSLAVVPCENYCPGFGTQCAYLVMGPDCMSACQGEANGFGPKCQALAIQSLECLTPFFTPGGSNCDAAVKKGLAKCGKIVDRFEKCKADVSGTPTPNPIPTPNPTGFDLAACAPVGALEQDPQCKQQWACPDGDYVVYCMNDASQPGTSQCGCATPVGFMNTGSQPTQVGNCVIATRLCDRTPK